MPSKMVNYSCSHILSIDDIISKQEITNCWINVNWSMKTFSLNCSLVSSFCHCNFPANNKRKFTNSLNTAILINLLCTRRSLSNMIIFCSIESRVWLTTRRCLLLSILLPCLFTDCLIRFWLLKFYCGAHFNYR